MIALVSSQLALLGASTGSSMWYLTRGSGAVAQILLTLSLVLGVLTTFESAPWGIPQFVVPHVHRNVSLAVLIFVAIHIATTVLDGYVDIVWLDSVIPFASPYHTAWLGLGTVALDLLLAITVTSLLRRQIGLRAWRLVHWFSYLAWPLAMVHGWFIGTDSNAGWLRWIDVICLALVAITVSRRFITPPRGGARLGDSPIGAKATATRWSSPRHEVPTALRPSQIRTPGTGNARPQQQRTTPQRTTPQRTTPQRPGTGR